LSSDIVLEVTGLTRCVDVNGDSRAIVDDFSFSFKRQQVYTILGPSGAGKSSLLRLLNRLDELNGGTVLLDGVDIMDILVKSLRRRIGHLSQTPFSRDQ